MQTTELKITGMMCEACVSHVSKALNSVPGVQAVTVNLPNGRATVQHDHADLAAMRAAVEEEGYEAEAAQ